MIGIVTGSHIYEFSHQHEPLISIRSGETIRVETLDCYSGHLKTEQDLVTDFPNMKPNPATGPIFVEGLEKGDLMKIQIKKIELNAYGIMPVRPNRGLLGEHVKQPGTRILPIREDRVYLNETVHFPVNKMIGVIGVAPAEGAVPNSTPGDHGGNMDTKEISEGNTLYLPVFHPGGLLALGDLHAAMGDGELNGSGVEAGGAVTLKIDRIKGFRLGLPLVKTAEEAIVIASAPDFHAAVRKAMSEVVRLIRQTTGLAFDDAYRLVSATCDLRISQLVNPEVTVRIAVPKQWVGV